MFFLPVNVWALLASAGAIMGIGFLWYSPVFFGKQWIKLANGNSKKVKASNVHMLIRYCKRFIATLIMVYILAQLENLMLVSGAAEGATLGAMVWLGFVAATMVDTVLFEQKSWTLFFISSGYHLASLLVAGTILAVWI